MEHTTLSDLTVILLQEGALEPALQEHLAHCAACAALLPLARLLAQEVWVARRSTPSAASLATYLQFDPASQKRSLGASIRESLETIRLALQGDSRKEQAALGLRGGVGSGYRLLYSTDSMDVDLMLAPHLSAWQVDGEVLDMSGSSEPYLVQLVGEAKPRREADSLAEYVTTSDEDGHFRFERVLSGRYDLILTPVEGPLYQISSLELS